jgi:hypothetical protein
MGTGIDSLQEKDYDKTLKTKDKSIEIKVNTLIDRELAPL